MSRRMSQETVAAARAAAAQISGITATLGPAAATLVLVKVVAATIVAHYPASMHTGIADLVFRHLEKEIARAAALTALAAANDTPAGSATTTQQGESP